MTYRVRRKLISSTFKVNQHLCKIFLEPWSAGQEGSMVWNVGFAVGKSRRQLNDWYHKRQNKRYRSLHKQLTGNTGIKTITKGFKEVLRLRWQIEPGDSIVLDCTSANPEKQFKAWQCFHHKHPEWIIEPIKKEFYWTRPPYKTDPVWKLGKIIPQVPDDLYCSVSPENYQDCFYIL